MHIACLALKIVLKFNLRTCNFVQLSAWHAQPAQIPPDIISESLIKKTSCFAITMKMLA